MKNIEISVTCYRVLPHVPMQESLAQKKNIILWDLTDGHHEFGNRIDLCITDYSWNSGEFLSCLPFSLPLHHKVQV